MFPGTGRRRGLCHLSAMAEAACRDVCCGRAVGAGSTRPRSNPRQVTAKWPLPERFTAQGGWPLSQLKGGASMNVVLMFLVVRPKES